MQRGSRNNDLASYAGWLRSKGCFEDEISRHLHSLNQAVEAPLPSYEVDAISASISRYPVGVTVEVDDIPLARLIAQQVAHNVCRTGATGWQRFDGARWIADPEGAHAKEVVKCALEELASKLLASSNRDAHKNAGHLLTASKVKRIIELIATDPQIVRAIEDFDNAPGKINLQNGTMSLPSRDLQPHSKEDMLTRVANVHYDEKATCPVFDKFLTSCFPPEEAAFVLRLFGYALLGQPKEQVFAIFHGSGRNGKSTLVEVMSHLLGDYACSAEPSSFIKQKNAGVRNDLARLKGARLVATSELSTGEILDAALVKRITGGDTIAARALYKEHFEFRSEFVMFMVTNNLPVIDGGDTALARRLILVPFEKVVPPDQCDPQLSAKLLKEANGIFNRLLEGCEDYLENGLNIPPSLTSAADKYIESSDLIAEFLKDRCIIEGEHQVSASALHKAYVRWCEGNVIKPFSQPIFKTEIMKRTNLKQKRTNKGNVWPGVGLRQRSFG
jgi:putative DNA primase/helicase